MLRKLPVLVAEDHQNICKMLISAVNTKYRVTRVVNYGEDPVDTAISLHPDAAMTGESMPRLTRPQGMPRLSSRANSTPSICVSRDPEHIEPDPRLIAGKLRDHFDLAATVEAVSLDDDTRHEASVLNGTACGTMRDSTNMRPRDQARLTYILCGWILCPILAWIVMGLTLWGLLSLCRL